MGEFQKRRWLHKLCNVHKINFLAIQETKLTQLDHWCMRQIWGDMFFECASSSARGKSGGILCMWNRMMFQCSKVISFDNYVVVEGIWVASNTPVMFISVYAPQPLVEKRRLWNSLLVRIRSWDAPVVVMGDFNEVREAAERYGSVFHQNQADIFNDFIISAELVDISMGGYSFTWTDKWAGKMSKLDRFLVSESFLEAFVGATGMVLEKALPDHRPILLKEKVVDYGPTPFRFFNSWLQVDDFKALVETTWKHDGIHDANGLVHFKKKLQNLKYVIREWNVKRRLKNDEV